MLLQYPHFDNLTIEAYRGENTYHALLARLEKRFTDGLMVQSSYTWSRFREKVAPLNPWEDLGRPRRRGGSAASHHARQRRRAAVRTRDTNGATTGTTVLDAILGGWQFSAKYEWQSGVPLVFNQNTYFDPAAAIRAI